jgi:hypothetical protein
MQTKIGTVRVSRGSQSAEYVALARMNGGAVAHSLRVRIDYDAYRDQSSGVIERWDGGQWREVYRMHGGELAGWIDGIAYRSPVEAKMFAADADTLINLAAEVLR